jgi:hypothetical protein
VGNFGIKVQKQKQKQFKDIIIQQAHIDVILDFKHQAEKMYEASSA